MNFSIRSFYLKINLKVWYLNFLVYFVVIDGDREFVGIVFRNFIGLVWVDVIFILVVC